jgi:bifunctional non-homologous end joining protein LigD
VHTEDHPLEYADFEGVIPEGNYGAGRMQVWDRGTWAPVGDAAEGLAEGHLVFDLHGERLQGRFVLVRLKRGERDKRDNWLLIKDRERHAGHDAPSRSTVSRMRGAQAANDDAARPSSPSRARAGTRAARSRHIDTADADVVVAGVAISNASRPIPDHEGLTKLDIVRYYEGVAAQLLPEIESRPLSLIRCPGGDFGRCFFRRHPDDERDLRDDLTGVPYVRVRTLRELIASVQGGTFEFHGWGSSFPRIDRPDRITLDLDPDPALDWETFREACELARALLDRLELAWFVKTTGGKGLHFALPIARRNHWDEVKAFAQRIAEHLAGTLPTLFTANMSKAKRKGRVFLDYLRNAEGATAVAAYSLRARPGLPVAMPIAWEALDQDVRGDHFNIGNVPQILAARHTDPWAGYGDMRQSIAAARRALSGNR